MYIYEKRMDSVGCKVSRWQLRFQTATIVVEVTVIRDMDQCRANDQYRWYRTLSSVQIGILYSIRTSLLKIKARGRLFNLIISWIPRCHLFTVATVLNSNCLSRGKAFTQIVAVSLIAAWQIICQHRNLSNRLSFPLYAFLTATCHICYCYHYH